MFLGARTNRTTPTPTLGFTFYLICNSRNPTFYHRRVERQSPSAVSTQNSSAYKVHFPKQVKFASRGKQIYKTVFTVEDFSSLLTMPTNGEPA